MLNNKNFLQLNELHPLNKSLVELFKAFINDFI